MIRKSKGDGVHITKVGLWFFVFLLIVGVAATNTGNNGLFLVFAVMGAAMVVSELIGWLNVTGLAITLEPPAEIFAKSPSHLVVTVSNGSRWLPRWLVATTVEPADIEPPVHRPRRVPRSTLVGHLPPRSKKQVRLDLMMHRRGRLKLRYAHVTSLFPLGFFRKGRRYLCNLDLLIYPEIFGPSEIRPQQFGRSGNDATRRSGWGHELLGLRAFRQGDDPRSIHWKQTARTGKLVLKEREMEENRRLLIVFDNAVGKLTSNDDRKRFERLVSEAATVALNHLEGGFEVSLTTREESIPFASGTRQRLKLLEALALIEPRAEVEQSLSPRDPEAPHARFAMEPADRSPREAVA